MSGGKKVDNKVKRKRGKKFVFHGNDQINNSNTKNEKNPFEDHSKSKRAKKDAEVR